MTLNGLQYNRNLEGANIKLAFFVTVIMGLSGRDMMNAMKAYSTIVRR
jgi:hypothetical protein